MLPQEGNDDHDEEGDGEAEVEPLVVGSLLYDGADGVNNVRRAEQIALLVLLFLWEAKSSMFVSLNSRKSSLRILYRQRGKVELANRGR